MAAKVIGMAHVLELSQDTLAQGSQIGDSLPLVPSPDRDTTELGGFPGDNG